MRILSLLGNSFVTGTIQRVDGRLLLAAHKGGTECVHSPSRRS